uniref:Membrane protein BRI3 n=1 Tax=Capra hircus TaxID=9925 RepID=A0A8C2QZP0_CAPHI
MTRFIKIKPRHWTPAGREQARLAAASTDPERCPTPTRVAPEAEFPVLLPWRRRPGGGPGARAAGPVLLAAPARGPRPSSRTGIPTHHPRVYNIHSRNVTRYPANSIVVVGGCPVCRVGVLEDSFTFLGIFLAIVLFPFGFICCFALRKRRCPNCGANFT